MRVKASAELEQTGFDAKDLDFHHRCVSDQSSSKTKLQFPGCSDDEERDEPVGREHGGPLRDGRLHLLPDHLDRPEAPCHSLPGEIHFRLAVVEAQWKSSGPQTKSRGFDFADFNGQ